MEMQRSKQKILCIPKRIQRTRNLNPVVPPQYAVTSRWKPFQVLTYLSSITGTPVASYYGTIRFSALLTEWIREGRPLCLAPTGNSLQVLSNLLVSAQRILWKYYNTQKKRCQYLFYFLSICFLHKQLTKFFSGAIIIMLLKLHGEQYARKF